MAKLKEILNDEIQQAYLIAAHTETPEYIKLTDTEHLPLTDKLNITKEVYEYTYKLGQFESGLIQPSSLTNIQRAFRKGYEIHNLQLKLLELLLCIIEKNLGISSPNISQTCEIRQDLPLLKPDDFLLSRLHSKIYDLIEDETVLANYLGEPKKNKVILFLWLILKEGFSKTNIIISLLKGNVKTYRIEEHWFVEIKNRRIWLSPMAELMLTAYWNDSSRSSINLTKQINQYLHENRLIPSSYLLSFHHLRSMMKNEFIINVSPIEYSICQSSLPTTSLDQPSLFRILTGKRVVHTIDEKQQREMTVRQKRSWFSGCTPFAEKLRKKTTTEQYEVTTSEQIQIIEYFTEKLIKAGQKESNKISSRLQEELRTWLENNNMAKAVPWCWLLLSWMYHLLRFGGKFKKRLRLMTVKAYITYVSAPFIQEFSGCAPKQMEGLDWAEKLNTVAEDIASTKKAYVLYFADFLIQSEIVTDLCLSDIDIPSITHHVNANLITQQEADSIIKYCEDINTPTAKLAKLCFCFGFYSGLRRGEIAGLQFSDITYVGTHYCNLHVRPNKYRELKSTESSRNLPLDCLWPSIQLQYLKDYLDVSKTKFTHTKSQIFKNSDELNQAFLLLTEIMKQVTSEPELRFHHCRHSFCNWTWIRLNYSDTTVLDSVNFYQHEFFNKEHQERLCQRLAISPFSRKKFWTLSNLLGHASPEVTTSSYFHLSEFIQRTRFACHLPSPTILRRYWGQRLKINNQGRLDKIPVPKHHHLDVFPKRYEPQLNNSDLETVIYNIATDKIAELKHDLSLHEVWAVLKSVGEGNSLSDTSSNLGIAESTVFAVITADEQVINSTLNRSKYRLNPLVNYEKLHRGNHAALEDMITLFEKAEKASMIPNDFKFETLSEVLNDLVGAKDSLIRTHNKNAALLLLKLMQLIGLTERHIAVKWYFPSESRFDVSKLNNYRKHLMFWHDSITEKILPNIKLEVLVPKNLMGHVKGSKLFRITASDTGKFMDYHPPGTVSIHLLQSYFMHTRVDESGKRIIVPQRTKAFVSFLRLIIIYIKVKIPAVQTTPRPPKERLNT